MEEPISSRQFNQPQPTPEPKKFSNKKVLIIVTVVLAIFVVGVISYAVLKRQNKKLEEKVITNVTLQPEQSNNNLNTPPITENIPSDWKTFSQYRDTAYYCDTAEFKYPPTLINEDFTVWDIVFSGKDTFDSWTNENKNLYAAMPGYNPLYPQPNSVEDFSSGTLRGQKRYFEDNRTELRITNEQRVLVIDIFDTSKANLEPNILINGIIASAKFLPLPVIDINSWKTFTSVKYSFSFKYPADWVVKEQSDGSVFLTSPDTEKILDGTTGERTDQINILPHKNIEYLKSNFPEPITISEEYFSSQKVKRVNDDQNTYIGKLSINGRTAFQILHSTLSDDKDTIISNPDGSIFIVNQNLFSLIEYSDPAKIEPYDTILSTLKFEK